MNALQEMSLKEILRQFEKPLFENPETHFARLQFSNEKKQITLIQYSCEFKEVDRQVFNEESRGAKKVIPALNVILAGTKEITAFLQRDNKTVNLIINGNTQKKIEL